jgi:hypothetical protein
MTLVRALAAIIILALCCTASAQISAPFVVWVGPITAGHCAKWVAPFKIGDAGGSC